ncbi:hypothetical protein HK101_001899 [Irineochytrium annulatum]|nr:hypothetical protein HK101_001899 [Irineochytrium annulatum]
MNPDHGPPTTRDMVASLNEGDHGMDDVQGEDSERRRSGEGVNGNEERPTSDVEMYIQTNKSVDGLFIRQVDVDHLGLRTLDEAETCYGLVTRISPVYLTAVSHSILVTNVFLLPAPFHNTPYGQGIVPLPLIHSLGVTVAIDRGMVYLVHPEALEDPSNATSSSSLAATALVGAARGAHQPLTAVREVEMEKDRRVLVVGDGVAVGVPGSVLEMGTGMAAAAEAFEDVGVALSAGMEEGDVEEDDDDDEDRNVLETVNL